MRLIILLVLALSSSSLYAADPMPVRPPLFPIGEIDMVIGFPIEGIKGPANAPSPMNYTHLIFRLCGDSPGRILAFWRFGRSWADYPEMVKQPHSPDYWVPGSSMLYFDEDVNHSTFDEGKTRSMGPLRILFDGRILLESYKMDVYRGETSYVDEHYFGRNIASERLAVEYQQPTKSCKSTPRFLAGIQWLNQH